MQNFLFYFGWCLVAVSSLLCIGAMNDPEMSRIEFSTKLQKQTTILFLFCVVCLIVGLLLVYHTTRPVLSNLVLGSFFSKN